MSEPSKKLGLLEIRKTQAPDEEDIVSLLEHAHLESRYKKVPFAQVRLRKFLQGAFKDTDGTAIQGFLARVDGEPVGLISASMNQSLTSESMFAATLMFYVKAEYRGSEIPNLLMTNIADWARTKNAREVTTHVTMGEDYGAERSNAYFRKMGFKSAGENFYLPLKET